MTDDRVRAAELGQRQVPVALDGEQAVALHPGHGLADGRAALVQPLGDAGAQRRHPLLFQLEDGAQVHLGGVDQVVRLHKVSGPPEVQMLPRATPTAAEPRAEEPRVVLDWSRVRTRAADLTVDPARRRLGLADPPTLLDVRWRLAGPPGRDDYDAGHLPGAVFVDLDADLCGPPGAGGRHPLPDPAALQEALRAAGVRDRSPGRRLRRAATAMAAARAWWTLRWAGHRDVRVLDGGFAAWVAAGRPVTTDEPPHADGDVTVRPGGLPVLDAAGAAALAAATAVLLDARVAAAVPGRDRADRPGRRAHPGRGQPARPASYVGPDGRFRPPTTCASGSPAARGRAGGRRRTAAPASPPRTPCSRCTWPGVPTPRSTSARGATGSTDPPVRPGRDRRASR